MPSTQFVAVAPRLREIGEMLAAAWNATSPALETPPASESDTSVPSARLAARGSRLAASLGSRPLSFEHGNPAAHIEVDSANHLR